MVRIQVPTNAESLQFASQRGNETPGMHSGHHNINKSSNKPDQTTNQDSIKIRKNEGTQHLQKEETNAKGTTTVRPQSRHQGRHREVDTSSETVYRTT